MERLDCGPQFSRRGRVRDLGEGVLGEGCEEVAADLAVLGQPLLIFRIDGRFRLVARRRSSGGVDLKKLRRGFGGGFGETPELSALQSGCDLSKPHVVVATS